MQLYKTQYADVRNEPSSAMQEHFVFLCVSEQSESTLADCAGSAADNSASWRIKISR